MTLVELSFIAIAFIGIFGVIGIAAVVTGRTPKACLLYTSDAADE